VDWVAEILWTGWQHSHGLRGNIPVDWVAEIRGIRTWFFGTLFESFTLRIQQKHSDFSVILDYCFFYIWLEVPKARSSN
jgi:hypothetical protein